MPRPAQISPPMIGIVKSSLTKPKPIQVPSPMSETQLENLDNELDVSQRAGDSPLGFVLAVARVSMPVAAIERTHGTVAYLRQLAKHRRRIRKDGVVAIPAKNPKKLAKRRSLARKPAKETQRELVWPDWAIICNCSRCFVELRAGYQPGLPDVEDAADDPRLRCDVKRLFKLKTPVRIEGRPHCPTCAKRRGDQCLRETGNTPAWLANPVVA